MLTSFTGFYQLLQSRTCEVRGGSGTETLFGTNCDVRVVNIPSGSSVTWQTEVANYTNGAPLKIRITWATSGTDAAATVQWQVQVAAISPEDAQNIATFAFGTAVSASAQVINATVNGLSQTTITLTSAAELNNLANLDALFIKLIDQATTGTPGTIRVLYVEVFN